MHQIVSIYYRVKALEEIKAPLRNTPFAFDESQMAVYHATGETETFRLIPMQEFDASAVHLPIAVSYTHLTLPTIYSV